MSPKPSALPGQESLLERTCVACLETYPPYKEFVSNSPRRVWNSWCRRCRLRGRGPRSRKAQGLGRKASVERPSTVHLAVVDDYPTDVQRPRTRGDCIDGPRPCPWVSCRHHLLLDVNAQGALQINHPDALEDFSKLPGGGCSLDIADDGGSSLHDVGGYLNVTRERARQLEFNALEKSAKRARLAGMAEDRDPQPKLATAFESGRRNPSRALRSAEHLAEPPTESLGGSDDDEAESSARYERVAAFSRDDNGDWDKHWTTRLWSLYVDPPKR